MKDMTNLEAIEYKQEEILKSSAEHCGNIELFDYVELNSSDSY